MSLNVFQESNRYNCHLHCNHLHDTYIPSENTKKTCNCKIRIFGYKSQNLHNIHPDTGIRFDCLRKVQNLVICKQYFRLKKWLFAHYNNSRRRPLQLILHFRKCLGINDFPLHLDTSNISGHCLNPHF